MIKNEFRAWYLPDKETKDGLLLFSQENHEDGIFFSHNVEPGNLTGYDLEYPFEIPFLDENWLVEQWSGLYDREGNKIFAGDIIQSKDESGIVYFAAGTFMIDGAGPLFNYLKNYSTDILEDFLVVGNKHLYVF